MNFMDLILGRRRDLISLVIDEAIALYERGEFDAGVAVIEEKALSREPQHRRALLHYGVGHMLKGDWDRAEQILEPISRQHPMDSESAAAEIALKKIRKDREKAGQA